MPNELTNLLLLGRQQALSRDYVIRLGVVVAVLAIMLVLSAAILLVPTYVLLSGNAYTKKMELTKIESSLSSTDEVAFSTRLAALSANVATLVSLSDVPSASATLRGVLALSRPGIALSGLSFTPSTDKSSGLVVVSGLSATRDALRSYQLTLQGASFVRSAALPVSAYAKDTDIPFTITITLSL